MDWYGVFAAEWQQERAKEIERYIQSRQILALVKKDATPMDKVVLAFGRWMVSEGKRLQARRDTCLETASALYMPSPRVTR
jgi:hypothetical protein